MDEVTNLFKSGQIDQYHYHTYIMFSGDDVGKRYLKDALDSILIEQCMPGTEVYYAGRVSVWRDIKKALNGINNLLEGKNYDGSDKPELIDNSSN